MVEAYNFVGSWQLYPEQGSYPKGQRPKSGIYRIKAGEERKVLHLDRSWVTLEDQAYSQELEVWLDKATVQASRQLAAGSSADAATDSGADAAAHEMAPDPDTPVAEEAAPAQNASVAYAVAESTGHLSVDVKANGASVRRIEHRILNSGLLQVEHYEPDTAEPVQTEVYHRQLSVLPYSSSVSGAVVKATESGVIRHKSLTAMEEQTNMQLSQIRQQIELLALQAQEVQRRKDLSQIIYDSEMRYEPVVGNTYYLYEKTDGQHMISMIGPEEWGRAAKHTFVAKVQLLADRTWQEV